MIQKEVKVIKFIQEKIYAILQRISSVGSQKKTPEYENKFLAKTEMPIPNEVFFGLNSNGDNVTFGDIRSILSKKEKDWEKELIELMKLRIKRILIEPVKKIDDPFVLITMTCVGIEALGNIFYPISSKSIEKSKPFREVAKQLHQQFGRPLTKKFKEKLLEMWSINKDVEKIDTLDYLLYRYLRNEMVHGFIAKGVYLSYEDTNTFEVIDKENEAYLIINPRWYFNSFEEVFIKHFYSLVENKSKLRNNLIKYIEKMVS